MSGPEQVQEINETLASLFEDREVDAYPEKLILPSVVHDGITTALEKTEGGYEHSLNFYHDENEWSLGKIFRGTQHRASILHNISTVRSKRTPEFHAHTHPPALDYVLPVNSSFGRLLCRLTGNMIDEDDFAVDQAVTALPSENDIATFLQSTFSSSLGYIVASETGIFTLLRNPSHLGWSIAEPKELTKEERKARFDQEWEEKKRIRKTIHEAKWEARKTKDPKVMHSSLAIVTALLVKTKFTCYASTEPTDAKLERVLELPLNQGSRR